jgi:2-amino-4-hydroxy-6-hydroxymethyldihydropteridine diphosphokinase
VRYYVGLGSNLGQRAVNLAEALVRLSACPGLRLERLSRVYETAPVGVTAQPSFLNMALAADWAGEPEALLAACLDIERAMGRVRGQRWGPRLIDLDLLLYDGPPLTLPHLQLPHPRLLERQFVLVPLSDIAPQLLLPGGRPVAAAAQPDAPGITLLGPLAHCVQAELGFVKERGGGSV